MRSRDCPRRAAIERIGPLPVPAPETESAIADDDQLLGSLLGSTSLAVLHLDDRGVVRAQSPAALRLLGPGVVGLTTAELLRVGADGTTVLVHPDGRTLLVHPDAVVLTPGQGRLAVVIGSDTTVDELQARFDRSPIAQCRVDVDGTVVAVNTAMEALLGDSDTLLRGRNGIAIFAGQDRPGASEALALLVGGETDVLTQERTLLRRDGSEVRVSVTAAVVRADPAAPYLAVSVQDLTPLRQAQRAVSAGEARLRALLRHATDVVVVVAASGRFVYVSPAVADRLGYDPETMRAGRALDLNHPDDVATIRDAFARVQVAPGAVVVFQCRVRHADGTWRWTEQRYTNLLDDPDVGGVVVNLREITEQRRAEQDLRSLAVRDSLTGLANRTLLLDRLEQAVQRSRRTGEQAGLVLLDVVRMREHNDRLGHDGGDALLIVLSERLVAASGAADSVARTGQDGFAVLVEDVTSNEDLRVRTAALLDAAAEPLVIAGQEVAPALRAGVALTPAESAGALLAAAEGALRDRDLLHDAAGSPRPAVRQAEDAVAHEELAQAIRGGQLRLHYQPVVRLTDGSVAGAEALVRWQHPVRGLLGPVDFVPFAESSGLVVELGEWVLREACGALAGWLAQGRELLVGVNLSPRQLAVPGFGALVQQVLAACGVPAANLVLEVTESALMDDDGALEALDDLHAMGVRLALDDFGTGYSSLTYLKRFPVNALKIDRSFVGGLGRDRDDEAIVASVVSLARSIGKGVVAEGVEHAGQLQALQALGVDEAQGFLWSPALPADELERWLDARVPSVPAAPQAGGPPSAGGSSAQLSSAELCLVEERIAELQADGASLHTIAAALNREGSRSPANTRWQTRSVAQVIAHMAPRVAP